MRLYYYLTSKEIVYVLDELSKKMEYDLVKTGLFENESLIKVSQGEYVDYFENTPTGDWVHNNRFIIVQKNQDIVIRKIEQRKGGYLFAVDQFKNKDSIIFVAGGDYEENVIIAGEFSSTKMPFSKKGIKEIKKILKSFCVDVKGWFVSPFLLEGYRLTTDVNSSREYDLNVSEPS